MAETPGGRRRPSGSQRGTDTPPDQNSTRSVPFSVVEEPPTATETPNVPGPRHSALYPKLVQFYGTVGIAVAGFGDRECGVAVAASAEGCAEAWDELAKQNASVKRVLEMVLQTGAWSAVIAAHFPIALAVTQHHRPDIAERFSFGTAANEGKPAA